MSNVSSVKNLNGEVFSAIQDASLTDYVNNNSPIWSEITGVSSTYAKQTDLEQVSGDLKSDIDYVSANAITSLDGYATTSEVNSTSSILSGAIDYVSANAGTTYTGIAPIVVNGDTISADSFDLTIGSGLAFENNTLYVSAESVPEGVMVESACEFNAVNEISGYNGSAIAQYGAEKQWLQHDDTIVHVANSAQYAFGVNVSALQRLMGVDETVLYDDANGAIVNSENVITLNESLQNFEMIKITDNSLPVGGDRRLTTIPVSTATKSIATNDAWFDVSYNPTQGTSKYIGTNFYSANDAGTQIRMNGSYITNMSNTGAWNNRNQGRLYKIIGVHRISG